MADYWKSQAKKFCDFCKCWIADNRPSVEFHEKGKRHKENVTQRLKDIGKKSAKEHKELLNVDQEMKKMEEAALKAYMKDVEANADLTSQVIKQKIAEKEKKDEEEKEKTTSVGNRIAVKGDESEDEEEKEVEQPQPEPENEVKMWYEAVSDEGYTYYWHVETGESIWEPPEEGFMSVAEQKKVEEEEAKKKAKEEKKAIKKKEEEQRKKREEEKEIYEEQRAWVEREKMRRRRVKDEEKEKEKERESVSPPIMGPAPRIDPYGGWTKVEMKEEDPLDLQLPQQEYVEIKVPAVSEPQVKFKEKKVANLTDECGTSSSFKKRKFNSNSKRSIRQRLDED